MRTHLVFLGLILFLFSPLVRANSQAQGRVLEQDAYDVLRDPFVSLVALKSQGKSELEMYPVKDLKLTGVITGPKKMRALIAAPNGKSFFVSMNDGLGLKSGKVVSIQPDRVVIVESSRNIMGEIEKDRIELPLGGEARHGTFKR